MTAVTIFNGLYCDADSVVKDVVNITGRRLVTDIDVIDEAARLSGIPQETILRHFPAGGKVAESELSDQERVLSALRFAMAEMVAKECDLIFWGYMALLPPSGIESMLKVCLIAEMDARLCTAKQKKGYSVIEARELIRADDQIRSDLVLSVTDCNDPWCESLYDLLIPVDSIGIHESARFLVQQLANAEQDSFPYKKSMEDFWLETKVQADLACKGHDVSVCAKQRSLTLRFDNHHNTLKNMSSHLVDFVSGFDGVEDVEIGVGRQYNHNDIFSMPPMSSGEHSEVECSEYEDEFSGILSGDAELASEIQRSFSGEGLDVSVSVKDGYASIRVNDHYKMLKHLARNLSGFVSEMSGVQSVEIGVGSAYPQIDGYKRVRREYAESFIGDDKRVFALALSDRLQQRLGNETFAEVGKPAKRKTLPATARTTSITHRLYSYR